MTRDVGFAMRGLVHIRLPLGLRAANDDLHLGQHPDPLRGEPPPIRPPPTVRPLDDLSVRRAERDFLKS